MDNLPPAFGWFVATTVDLPETILESRTNFGIKPQTLLHVRIVTSFMLHSAPFRKSVPKKGVDCATDWTKCELEAKFHNLNK